MCLLQLYMGIQKEGLYFELTIDYDQVSKSRHLCVIVFNLSEKESSCSAIRIDLGDGFYNSSACKWKFKVWKKKIHRGFNTEWEKMFYH